MADTISKVKCNRCGHEWFPRQTVQPKWCSKCKSPYWNKPRIRGANINETNKL